MEGFGHEVGADAEEGEGSFDAADEGSGGRADGVEERGDLDGFGLEGADGGEIAAGGGVVEGGVEGGEEIGSGVDAAVGSEEDGFGGELFVADEDRPVGAL